jgi:uncharacterized protein YbjT (DUF2867 family)
VHEHGELRYPLPEDLPNPWVAADDLAAAVADLITAPAAVRLVAGPSALTGPAVAAAVSAAAGRPIGWRTITPGEYAAMLTPHLGPDTAAGIAAVYEHPAPPPDPALVVPGATTVRAWAAGQDWTAGR